MVTSVSLDSVFLFCLLTCVYLHNVFFPLSLPLSCVSVVLDVLEIHNLVLQRESTPALKFEYNKLWSWLLNHMALGTIVAATTSASVPGVSLVPLERFPRPPPSNWGHWTWRVAGGRRLASLWCWMSQSPPSCPLGGDGETCLTTRARWMKARRRKRMSGWQEPPKCEKWSCHLSFPNHRGCMWCQSCSARAGRNFVGHWGG